MIILRVFSSKFLIDFLAYILNYKSLIASGCFWVGQMTLTLVTEWNLPLSFGYLVQNF